MDLEKVKSIIEAIQPETDNLIVVGIIVYLIYATYFGSDVMRLADTAIGGLIGYLGASAKSTVPRIPIPPSIVTGIKP